MLVRRPGRRSVGCSREGIEKGQAMAHRSVRLAVGGAVLAALVTTGCAQAPSNYAVVNGEAISSRDVSNTVDNINEELGRTAVDARQVGNLKVLRIITEDIAEDENLNFRAAQLDEYLVAQGGGELLSFGAATQEYARDSAFVSLVQERVGDEVLGQAVNEADVTVNPRFGTWSPNTLVTPGSGSLGQVAPRPAQN